MLKGAKRFIRLAHKAILGIIVRLKLKYVYSFFGTEGINRLLASCNSDFISDILRKYGATIGKNGTILTPIVIHNAEKDYSNLKVGNNCHIGKEVFLDLRNPIIMENCVTISMRAMVLTHLDVGDSPLKSLDFPTQLSSVILKQGVYIGAGAIILHGVTVGECAVVGAGAVVTKDIPPYSVAIGVPARVIRIIDSKKYKKG